jgi:hypothetical protein
VRVPGKVSAAAAGLEVHPPRAVHDGRQAVGGLCTEGDLPGQAGRAVLVRPELVLADHRDGRIRPDAGRLAAAERASTIGW